MLEIIHEAGWPIWLLIATSVLGLALIIERFLSLRTKLILPPRLAAQVLELIRQRNDTPEAITKLAASSPLGRVLAEALLNRNDDEAYRTAAIEEVGKDVAHRLNRYLPALATIAVIAPLMGLFGTVVGMIEIFASYSPTGGDPAQLARGISMALYNTGFGIIIAIPALIFHRYFRSKVEHCLHQMEREASALNRMLAKKTQAGPEASR
ncbi:MotA/TolQ/ExbB proton channel family protein [Paralcaligenes sp. KSB-10]|uniref:MotA/TolQ/ExbB proton channel family protein n=1 Tax=Paralcaligenes sp. KSB-10 TaxID=2901142 RepID=UPI001E5EBA38|nr:MotA/TolQ/ExbB proton channel family protein [Paralcaligenes sp. KSB-10]UHL64496.1 MotA/TolQ/ExbB proton channel family protein [Paralcaligenes sp. KSB-10]